MTSPFSFRFFRTSAGADGGIRTHTERVLSASPPAVGLRQRCASGRSCTFTRLGLGQLPLLLGYACVVESLRVELNHRGRAYETRLPPWIAAVAEARFARATFGA